MVGAYGNLEQDVELLLGDGLEEKSSQLLPPTQVRTHRNWVLFALVVGSALAAMAWKGVQPSMTSSLGDVVALDADTCSAAGGEFTLMLPAFGNKTVSVPPISSDKAKYTYAADFALVSIPDACFSKFKTQIKHNTTVTDRGATSGTAYFYLSDLEGGYETLAKMSDCSCGLLIEMHGSGGPGWTAVQLAAMFARSGYVAVLPNSMAQPKEMGLKGKFMQADVTKIDTSDYCKGYNAFAVGSAEAEEAEDNRKCSKFSEPYCYSTKVVNVVNNSENYKQFVEGVYEIRKLEMDAFMDEASSLFTNFDRVFLAGNSEGAMAASRYHHADLDAKLKGRILSAWSCNFNYFVSCPAHAQICGDQCNKDVPQLNLIGTEDEYFGASGSVSSKVAADEKGYGGPITGSCKATYEAQAFTKATVVKFEGAGHGPQYWDDNTWRGAIADFIANEGDNADQWPTLLDGDELRCKKDDEGAYSCPSKPPKETTCCVAEGHGCPKGWAMNPDFGAVVPEDVTRLAC